MDSAREFYFYNLHTDDQQAILSKEYLYKRGLNFDVLNKFKLGFSFERKNELTNFLKSKGFEEKEIINSGLVSVDTFGNIKDKFINRIMFPITNDDGKVVAFSGRTLSNEIEPKYLLTPANQIFDKSNILFNWDKTKFMQEVVILEGFMDILKCFSNDVDNCVALMGVELTDKHVNKFNENQRIILNLDGDSAGVKANAKNAGKLLRAKKDVWVVDNNSFLDPDEYIDEYGIEKYKDMLKNNLQDPIEYFVNKTFDFNKKNNYHFMNKWLTNISDFSIGCKNQLMKETIWNQVKEITYLSNEVIEDFLQNPRRKSFSEMETE